MECGVLNLDVDIYFSLLWHFGIQIRYLRGEINELKKQKYSRLVLRHD
jgi:hypothetical protein